jgi:hypothetical protein
MADSDKIRLRAESWVRSRRRGEDFHLADLYGYLYSRFESDCDARGLIAGRDEPQYKHDARQAIRDCKSEGIITPIRNPHSGHYRRV